MLKRYLVVAMLVALTMACESKPAEVPVTPPPAAFPPPVELPRAFQPGPFTRPMPRVRPGDWLAQHKETGQTFEEFVASGRLLPTPERGVIYLQPIGEFSGDRSVSLERLQKFTTTFFKMPVVVNEPIPVADFEFREHPDLGRQIRAGDVLEALDPLLPADAYCMLGITLEDLYPSDDWNYVFGMASLQDRVGVFSFARYSPRSGALSEADTRKLTLRAFKVLSHEIGHMFGIKHCTAYRCGLNGSNSLNETDSSPLAYCPVCLQKLHSSVGFDVAQRYGQIAEVLSEFDLESEAARYRERRAWVLAGDEVPGTTN